MVVAGRGIPFTLPWLPLGGGGEVVFKGCHAGLFQCAFVAVRGQGAGDSRALHHLWGFGESVDAE